MRITTSVAGLLAIAAIGYLAGRYDLVPAPAPAHAQEPDPAEMEAYLAATAPDEHHARLEPLAGTWEGSFRIWMAPDTEPMTTQGTIKRQWVLGGRFLKETVEATSDMGSFEAVAYLGYNKLDGRYEFVWMENMSTAMYFESGRLDPDTNVLYTGGTYRDPVTGKAVASRGEVHMTAPDRHYYVSWSTDGNGREFKSFEGAVERVR